MDANFSSGKGNLPWVWCILEKYFGSLLSRSWVPLCCVCRVWVLPCAGQVSPLFCFELALSWVNPPYAEFRLLAVFSEQLSSKTTAFVKLYCLLFLLPCCFVILRSMQACDQEDSTFSQAGTSVIAFAQHAILSEFPYPVAYINGEEIFRVNDYSANLEERKRTCPSLASYCTRFPGSPLCCESLLQSVR